MTQLKEVYPAVLHKTLAVTMLFQEIGYNKRTDEVSVKFEGNENGSTVHVILQAEKRTYSYTVGRSGLSPESIQEKFDRLRNDCYHNHALETLTRKKLGEVIAPVTHGLILLGFRRWLY